MAGELGKLIRRAAPGAYEETPDEQYKRSVMSPDYRPETDGRQLLYGGIRGLLDATPAGLLDAAQAGLNRLPTAGGALVRAVTGRAQGPVEAGMGLLGMQGSGPGYEAGRAASGAAVAGMGLLGNQASGQLPRGYARDESGAIVWHGSPHRFDKFDSSKIGTGEGAQAYGHGLYLAESRGVAKGYKNRLASLQMTADGKTLTPMTPEYMAATDIYNKGYDRALREATSEWTAKLFPNRAQDIEALRAAKIALEKQGNLYKVDLPDEQIARMLNWDRPLYRQPPTVRRAVRAVVDENTSPGTYAQWVRSARPDMRSLQNDMLDSMDNAAIAEALTQKGIPGIRYLDGGSRGAGAGTSNYVVFPGNEGLLKILGRE